MNLLKSKSKDFYWLFINKANSELEAPKKWARDLLFNDIELTGYFKSLKRICVLLQIPTQNHCTKKGTLFKWYRVQQRMPVLPGA